MRCVTIERSCSQGGLRRSCLTLTLMRAHIEGLCPAGPHLCIKTGLTPRCATSMAGSSTARPSLHAENSPHTPLRNNYCSSSSSSQMVKTFRATPPLPPFSSICGSLSLWLTVSVSLHLSVVFLCSDYFCHSLLPLLLQPSSSSFPTFPLCDSQLEIQQFNLNPLHLSP